MIEQTPAMKQVQQIAQKQEEAARQQSEAAAKARVDAEIAEIHKLDPTISEVKDLLPPFRACGKRRSRRGAEERRTEKEQTWTSLRNPFLMFSRELWDITISIAANHGKVN